LGEKEADVATHLPRAQAARRLCDDLTLAAASDRELLARAADPASGALADLVRRHQRTVLAACRQVLADPADVEDAFQATFLVLLQEAGRLRCGGSLGGWMFAVAHRISVRALRSRARTRRHETAAARPEAVNSEPGAELSWREGVAILHEALDGLADRFRLPLLLCYLDGLSRDEAAAQLGWSLGAVKAGLERGRQRLRTVLQRRGVTLGAGALAALAGMNSAAHASPALVAAAVQAATGGASAAVIELARPTMTTLLAKAKLLLLPVVAAGLCVGLLAARTFSHPTGSPPSAKAGATELRGRVTGPDGKPVAGAKLYAVKRGGAERVALATSAADGTFRLARPTAADGFVAMLLAHKDGFGHAWHELDEDGTAGVIEMKLSADNRITGRVIDTEGKPVAGARVFPQRITAPKAGNLDAILGAMKANTLDYSHPTGGLATRQNWAGAVVAATTGADGRFSLAGSGTERLIEVSVSADGFADRSVQVVNRPKFDPRAINAAAEAARKETPGRPARFVSGPEMSVILERGKPIEGVVLDAATKKPVAGAWVSDLSAGVKTDAAGRFKLSRARKAKSYTLYVGASEGSLFLPRTVRVDDTEGYTPVTCSIELRRGVVVTGRVTDRATGKPASAGVVVVPLSGNKYFHEYHPGSTFAERTTHHTDKDGRFRVVTVPGKLLVTVQGFERVTVGDARLMPFRGAGIDPAHPDEFKSDRMPGAPAVQFADMSLQPLSNADHGVRVIHVPPDAKPVVLGFALERGVAGRVRFAGPDGKPVSGVTAHGLDHAGFLTTLSESAAPVLGLDTKGKARVVTAWHAEKRLGGTASVRGDEKEPVVVKLAPLATLRGKVASADGKPVAGALVLIDAVEGGEGIDTFLSEQFGVATGSRVKTAADGTFTVSGVLPGVEYQLRLAKGRTVVPVRGKLSAKPGPGEVVDLGKIDAGSVRDE
jgi:RNA polymerase sigma factor (sigma-70 family)